MNRQEFLNLFFALLGVALAFIGLGCGIIGYSDEGLALCFTGFACLMAGTVFQYQDRQ